MGQSLVVPKFPLIGQSELELLKDYNDILLLQVEQSFYYWNGPDLDGRTMITYNQFEDVFGSLFDDSERHFRCFVTYGTATCNPMEAIMVIIFLTSQELEMDIKTRLAIDLTIKSLPGVKSDDPLTNIKVSDIQKMVFYILVGFSRIFTQVKVPPIDELNQFVLSSLAAHSLRNCGQVIKSETTNEEFEYMTQNHAKSMGTLTLSGILNWCQDTQEVYKFLDSVTSVVAALDANIPRTAFSRPQSKASSRPPSRPSSRPQSQTAHIPSTVGPTLPPPPPPLDCSRRQHGPLWKYTIMDMFTTSWVQLEMPLLLVGDPVFKVLEYLVLLSFKSLPIMVRESAAGEPGQMQGLGGNYSSLGFSFSNASMQSHAQLGGLASQASFHGGLGRAASRTMQSVSSGIGSLQLSTAASKSSIARKDSKFIAGKGAEGGGSMNKSVSRAGGLGSSSSRASITAGNSTPNKHNQGSLGRSGSKAGLSSSASSHKFARKASKSQMSDDNKGDIFASRNNSALVSSARMMVDPVSGKEVAVHADKTKVSFVGSVDFSTILFWFAESCPKTITAKGLAEYHEYEEASKKQALLLQAEELALAGKSGQGLVESQSSRHSLAGDHNSSDKSLHHGAAAQSQQKTGGRRNREGADHHNLWTECGNTIIQSSIQSAMSTGSTSSRPQYTMENIMLPDQFVYNVFDMFAQGYRAIPIASKTNPFKVTHMLTSADAVQFLYYRAVEIFGTLIAQPICELKSLVRTPVKIPSTLSYGAACSVLAESDVDAAVLVDEKGRMSGVFRSSSVGEFWLSWWKLFCARGAEDSYSMEKLQKAFAEGSYQTTSNLRDLDPKVYSFFTALQNPLKLCGHLGVNVVSFDTLVGPIDPPAPKQAFGMSSISQVNESDDSSSTSSSSSSSSGSSDSGRQSNEKRPGKKSSTAKPPLKKSDRATKGRQAVSPRPAPARPAALGRPVGSARPVAAGPAGTRLSNKSQSSPRSTPQPHPPSVGTKKSITHPQMSRQVVDVRGSVDSMSDESPSPPSSRPGSRPDSRDSGPSSHVPTPTPPAPRSTLSTKKDMETSLLSLLSREEPGVIDRSAFSKVGLRSTAQLSSVAQFGLKKNIGATGVSSVMHLSMARIERRDIETSSSSTLGQSDLSGAVGARSTPAQSIIEATAEEWSEQRKHKFRDFCSSNDAVESTETLYTVLERMHLSKTHKVFLLSSTGEPVGVVSLMDIARDIILREGKEKEGLNDVLQARVKSDVCVVNTLKKSRANSR